MNQTYIVKRGDTLYGISNQFGVSVTELASLNNVNANTLKVGQTLIIPNNSGTNPDTMFYYTVKKGDSLYNIARLYNTTVDEIKKLNYLKNNNLYIGQVLRIPEMYTKPEDMVVPNYINYKVQKGDTLYSIAKRFNTSVDTIMQDNSLKSMNLTLGQNIRVRTMNSFIDECFGDDYIPSNTNNNSTKEYIVKRGDSLYSIAKNNNTSVSEIINLNKLNNSVLSIGQVLKIPSNSSGESTYMVKKGDNLYSISKKFNTTVDFIKKKNNLTSNNLSIGQILKI